MRAARLARRRAMLRSALRQGQVHEAAWASARLRIRDAPLDAPELAAARSSRIALGRALRRARRRQTDSAPPIAAVPHVPKTAARRARRRSGTVRAAFLFVGALAVLVAVLLNTFNDLPSPDDQDEEGALAQPVEQGQSMVEAVAFSRGRTAPDQRPVRPKPQEVARVEPPPPPQPASSAPAATGPNVAGTPAGRTGGGSGAGTGAGPGSGTGTGGAPSATPTPRQVPIRVPPNMTRFRGRVLDAITGAPIPGVCVINGVRECGPLEPYSDANGVWVLDVPVGAVWDLHFKKDGYQPASLPALTSRGGGFSFILPDVRLTPIR